MVRVSVLCTEKVNSAVFLKFLFSLCAVTFGLIIVTLFQANSTEYLNAYMNGAAQLIILV